MEKKVCADCAHFRQHYLLSSDCVKTVNCGHCVHPGLKHRKPQIPACEYYSVRREPAAGECREDVRRFLTTEMLRYILSLELPPQIKEVQQDVEGNGE